MLIRCHGSELDCCVVGYGDDHHRDVAAAYRQALQQAPGAPTKWIAERYHVSVPTARRWIQRARDKGYLGASTPGKAGEQPVKKRRKR